WASPPRSSRPLRCISSVTRIICRNSAWWWTRQACILPCANPSRRNCKMDLTLSDEQRLLRESVDRFVGETCTAEHRRKTAAEPNGFSAAVWKQFAELGWLALPIAEEHGGLGGGAIDVGILMEAFGRGLVSEPYLSTVVIGAGLIAACGSDTQKAALLPKVADGSLYLAFAHAERAARFDLAKVETSATKTQGGWRLNGHKIAVLDGNAAGE